MSNGLLKIRAGGAGEYVPAMGVFDAVSQGSAEIFTALQTGVIDAA